jgi:uncharacterized protein DUF5681
MPKDYGVGYKKPPVHTRFKKGRSGNPAGRPRRKEQLPNIERTITDALNAPVTVNESGRIRQITKFQATITQLINKCAGGHLPSMKLLMPFFAKFSEAASEADREATAKADDDSYERIMRRLDEMLERKRQSRLLLADLDSANNRRDEA